MSDDFDEDYDEMEAYFAFEEDFDHEYRQTKDKNTSELNNNNQGCYVATCVYGSYDCPEVWTLRRFRDYTLAKSWHGRTFIHIYYSFAPTLVKLFGKTQWFSNLFKPLLDKKVNQLNDEGVENTPYQDGKW